MAMFTLYGDPENHEIISDNERDCQTYPGRYFEIYGFEGDQDDHFEETWMVIPKDLAKKDKKWLIKIVFDRPQDSLAARRRAEEDYELVTLTRLRVPEWFYKEYYY